MIKKNWMTFRDTKTLSEHLVRDILSVAKESIKKNSKFSIVLAGGNSFIDSYKILRKSNSDWKKWHIYICDERCLPINDRERNDKIINDVWLNNNKIPKKNINFIKAELGIKNAVQQYEVILNNIIREIFNDYSNQFKNFLPYQLDVKNGKNIFKRQATNIFNSKEL